MSKKTDTIVVEQRSLRAKNLFTVVARRLKPLLADNAKDASYARLTKGA